jgi:xylulokinase
MALLLGIDIGTSGCKVILIDESGAILRQANATYPIFVPEPKWSEQNPEDWWNGVQACLAEINEPNIDAIGVTGQMHGSVFLDENDDIIRPALLWNDQRTVSEVEEITQKVGEERLKEITCNPAMTGFQLPKILWLRNNEPENFKRLKSVLLPKDYIRLKLTGVKATEVSDASGTGIFDVKNRKWSTEITEVLDLDVALFPPCFESDVISGHTPSGVPVVGGGGDQAAAAVGTGAVEPGVISVSLGTSGVVFTSLPSAEYDAEGSAHTFCHANRGWHAMGVMLSCGGALQWYRNTLGGGRNYDEITQSASTVPVGAGGLVFMPYLTGERCPHNNPNATAGFFGATAGHTIAHFDRAVLEGLTFGLKDGYDLLRSLGASSTAVRVTSGGSKSDFWLQMIADVFQTPCERLVVDEGPALGAAILAGVGIGVWDSVAEGCKKVVKVKQTFTQTSNDYSKSHQKFVEFYHLTKELNER